jgi:hypothetical protein
MKTGLDSSVLVASVKKIGEPFHDSSIALPRKIKDEDGAAELSLQQARGP